MQIAKRLIAVFLYMAINTCDPASSRDMSAHVILMLFIR